MEQFKKKKKIVTNLIKWKLPYSHGKGIDILVKLVQQRNSLDNHVVYSVDIELDFGSGVAVAQTKLSNTRGGLGKSFHQIVEVETEAWARQSTSS